MDLDTILDKLGGDTAVAAALGCGAPAISNWKVRGIPSGRKYDLLKLAIEQKKEITIEDIEEAHLAIKPEKAN